jgi:hypothetical protein
MLLQSWQQQLHVAPMPAATTCLVQTGTQQAAPGEHLVQCSAHVVESSRGTGSRHAQRLTRRTLLHTTRHRNQGGIGCTGHWQQGLAQAASQANCIQQYVPQQVRMPASTTDCTCQTPSQPSTAACTVATCCRRHSLQAHPWITMSCAACILVLMWGTLGWCSARCQLTTAAHSATHWRQYHMFGHPNCQKWLVKQSEPPEPGFPCLWDLSEHLATADQAATAKH